MTADQVMADQEIQSVGFPVSVEWYVTYQCNLSCLHCCTTSSPYVSVREDLPTNQAVELIGQMADLGVLAVTLIGGEPLVRKDLLRLMESISDHGMNIKISTNGMLLNPSIVSRFKRWNVKAQVSLEGVGRYHDMIRGEGSFERTRRGLTLLLEDEIPVLIRATVTKATLDGIPDLLCFADALGVDIWLETVWRDGRAIEYWPMLGTDPGDIALVQKTVEEFKQSAKIKVSFGSYYTTELIFPGGCSWGDNLLLVIAPDGTVAPCSYALSLKKYVPFPKFPEYSLRDIVSRHPYFTFKSQPIDRSLLPETSDKSRDITKVFDSRVCKVETFKAMYGLPTASPGARTLEIFTREAERCSE